MSPTCMHAHTCVFDRTLTPDSINCCVTAVEINVSKFRRTCSTIQHSYQSVTSHGTISAVLQPAVPERRRKGLQGRAPGGRRDKGLEGGAPGGRRDKGLEGAAPGGSMDKCLEGGAPGGRMDKGLEGRAPGGRRDKRYG